MLKGLRVVSLKREEGDLRTVLAAEFPTLDITLATDLEGRTAYVSASDWNRPEFDTWAFDCGLDELDATPFILTVLDDEGDGLFPFHVLNRCQRLIGRRNDGSRTGVFDHALRLHRLMHDLSKPLVRADYNHSLDVWQWLLRLDGDAGEALQLAALFHDIERLATEADGRIEHLTADYRAFKDAHAERGAAMAGRMLEQAGAGASIRDRVIHLIAHHERRSNDEELTLLNDADALSFFSFNSSGYAGYFGSEQTKKKVAYTWERMSPRARERLGLVYLREDVRRYLVGAPGMSASIFVAT